MAWNKSDLVQRGHHFAIVDEVDSILIDEARTPLIISGPAGDPAMHRWYTEFARLAPVMQRDVHYEVEEGKRTVAITEEGVERSEEHTSELQSRQYLVCRLLLEKKKKEPR